MSANVPYMVTVYVARRFMVYAPNKDAAIAEVQEKYRPEADIERLPGDKPAGLVWEAQAMDGECPFDLETP